MGFERYLGITLDRLTASHDLGRAGFITPSPYDVPTGVITKVKDDGTVELIFEYIDREPEKYADKHGRVEVFLGKNSGKVLRLHIAIPPSPSLPEHLQQLRDTILEAIEKSGSKGRTGEMNRMVTHEILDENFEELVAPTE